MRGVTILLLVLGVLCGACRQSPGTAAPGSPTEDGFARSTPISRAVPLEAVGAYGHSPSGVVFPENTADFKRIVIKRYDLEENDVGVGYRRLWPDSRAELTLYVYPPPIDGSGERYTLERGFNESVHQVFGGKQDVEETARTTLAATHAGEPVAGRAALIEFRSGPSFGMQRVVSPVVVYELPKWHLKYRLTAHAAQAERTYVAVDELLAELGLPPLGLPIARDE